MIKIKIYLSSNFQYRMTNNRLGRVLIVVVLTVFLSSLRPVSNNTSLRLAMRPQIVQVKSHLTHATSDDRFSISKKLFSPVAFFETIRSENRVDITWLVSTYNGFCMVQPDEVVNWMLNCYLMRCNWCGVLYVAPNQRFTSLKPFSLYWISFQFIASRDRCDQVRPSFDLSGTRLLCAGESRQYFD